MHLASRVEAATKELRVPLVATQPTVERLSESFATNRVCRATNARLAASRSTCTPFGSSTVDARLQLAWQTYDEALRQFEQGDFKTPPTRWPTIDATVADVPSQFLLERVQHELGRKLRRRSTDKPAVTADGVIALSAK